MSKVISFLVAAAGASATSVGGFWLIKNGIGGETQENVNLELGQQASEKSQPKATTTAPFSSLDEFKNAKGGICTSDLFSDVAFDSATEIPENVDYFGTPFVTTSDDIKGCLIIDGTKDEYTVTGETKKGKGTFTGAGTFKNGGKGFVNFNVAKVNGGAKEMEFIGGFYLLEKSKTQDSSEKWEIKHKKEVGSSSNNKISSSSDFASYFPKSTMDQPQTKDYGGWIENPSKFDEICDSESVCKGDSSKNFDKKQGTGSSDTTGGKKVGEGCDSLEGHKKIFGVDSFDLQSKLTSFSGTGTKQSDTPSS